MSISENLKNLIGIWRGENRLHLSWKEESPFVSESNAVVAFSAQGKFLKIEYDWVHDGKMQDGLILIGNDKNSDAFKAFWVDSWHLSDKLLISQGIADSGGAVLLEGFYEVPDHSDWGWRTIIESQSENSFVITMYNVSPEGAEDLAVEAIYRRT